MIFLTLYIPGSLCATRVFISNVIFWPKTFLERYVAHVPWEIVVVLPSYSQQTVHVFSLTPETQLCGIDDPHNPPQETIAIPPAGFLLPLISWLL